MAKRVGVVLSGCGSEDGSEIQESILCLLSLERAGAQTICLAPAAVQSRIVDHLSNKADADAQPRRVLAEAARLARSRVRDIATVRDNELDALVFPGGFGAATVLSNYAEKGVVCDVHPDVIRLMKAMLVRRYPMGFVCLSPILAARVLGPITGVRVTFGARSGEPAKHAAIMGADVRPCPVRDILVDQKSRVVTTPAYMYEDARITDVAVGIEKMVRTLLSLARDRRPRPQAVPPASNSRPAGTTGPSDAPAAVKRRPGQSESKE
jgi:enhancing lycopene biosynthesis protein 2